MALIFNRLIRYLFQMVQSGSIVHSIVFTLKQICPCEVTAGNEQDQISRLKNTKFLIIFDNLNNLNNLNNFTFCFLSLLLKLPNTKFLIMKQFKIQYFLFPKLTTKLPKTYLLTFISENDNIALHNNQNLTTQIQSKISMSRSEFAQFQGKTLGKSCPMPLSSEVLNDSIFHCFIHWYIKPSQDMEDQTKMLLDLTKQFNVVLCVWKVISQANQIFNMIDVKAIQDIARLPKFIVQTLKVSKAILMDKNFRVASVCMINRFGLFQAQKCSQLCKTCGQQQKMNECCARFMCGKCINYQIPESCDFCNKNLKVSSIPLQTVALSQTKYIYQPMLPQLSNGERLQLKEAIEDKLSYN